MLTPAFSAMDSSDTASDDDRKLFVQFFMDAMHNEAKSEEAGRPIFDDVPMVKIIVPGSRDVLVKVATQDYQRRFPRQWERFMQQKDQGVDGTPLDQVPFLTVAQIAELRAFGCHTLEQLAGISDQAASKFMGMHSLRQRANLYLEAAKSAAPITALQAKLEERDSKIEVLENQIKELAGELKALKKPTTTKA